MSLKTDGAARGFDNVDVIVSFKSIRVREVSTGRGPNPRCAGV
jgi:hypothetical protein